MEQRVSRLEDSMRDAVAAIARIDVAAAEIRAVVPSLATKAELAQCATKADLAQFVTKTELAQQIAPLATKAELAQQIALVATKAELSEVKLDIAELDAKLTRLTEGFIALNTKFDQQVAHWDRHLATKEDFAELRGYVKGLPTTWVMVTAIVAGQVGITGVIAGALLAAAKMFFHS